MANGSSSDAEYAPDCVARSVDSQSFLVALVKENHASLIRFLRRHLGDHEDAADMAQELYYQIARHEDVSRITQPRAYLFQSARNLICNNNAQRISRYADWHDSIDDIPEEKMASTAPSPEQATQARQQLGRVEKALEELNPKSRTVFVLVRFDGMSYKDVAKHMGFTVKSVEYHMRVSLAHILRRVDDKGPRTVVRQTAE